MSINFTFAREALLPMESRFGNLDAQKTASVCKIIILLALVGRFAAHPSAARATHNFSRKIIEL
jgi:hypothetical protein